jgi:hypothetical protein
MNIYYFTIETDENENKKVVLDDFQMLPNTSSSDEPIARFHYDIDTKELVYNNWREEEEAAVPA